MCFLSSGLDDADRYIYVGSRVTDDMIDCFSLVLPVSLSLSLPLNQVWPLPAVLHPKADPVKLFTCTFKT